MRSTAWIALILNAVVALCVWTYVSREISPPLDEVPPREFLPNVTARETAYTVPANDRDSSKCFATYRRFYSRADADFRIVFGYKDSRPSRYVGDRYERLMLQAYLTAPCTDNRQACGFTVSTSDPDLLQRTVPAPEGSPVRVKIRLTHSSLSPDDDRNRTDPRQAEQTKVARDNLVQGLMQADLVFYNGHSRDGGGPDFAPPRLDRHGHPDYAWYMRERPGEVLLLDTLKEKSPSLLGLFSCRSGDHFLKEIADRTHGKTGTITTPQLFFYSDALEAMLVSLEAVLGRWCEKDFKAALSPVELPGRARLNWFRP